MSLRRLIVEVDTDGLNVTEFCRQHGVSTWFFWNLRRRFAAEGFTALEPISRAPRRVANRTSSVLEEAIVVQRKRLVDAGLDAGPATIAFHLRDLEGLPSEATIWRILKARGFITPDPSKAPRPVGKRFTATRANETWQLDDTSWDLADGSEVKILNIVDDHSRLLVASVALDTCTGAATFAVFATAAGVLGWPARFLSDNAKAFRHVLADGVAELGVAAAHSRLFHPQTNGKVERFHQTLKKWLREQHRAVTIEELQMHLDWFRQLYNHERPHKAHLSRPLGQRFPATVWTDAPKNGPADRPLTTATATWPGTVNNGMAIVSNRYRITIGAKYNGAHAITVITGLQAHVFIDGRLIRQLTIDPTRQHQTLYNRPGKPRQLTVREDPRHP